MHVTHMSEAMMQSLQSLLNVCTLPPIFVQQQRVCRSARNAHGLDSVQEDNMLHLTVAVVAAVPKLSVAAFSLQANLWGCIAFQKMCLRFIVMTMLHRCRKSNTYKLLTPISTPRHINFSNLIMQKYELSRQTHKMTIFLRLELYKILLYTARIAYENTYDMRAMLK